jgi:hypothetical protein
MLRAPRCFLHPAWVPRQNLTSSLDAALTDFLAESGLAPSTAPAPRRTRRPGVRTEGVHIGCAASPLPAPELLARGDEQDEMIWWAWDGRLTGFADW